MGDSSSESMDVSSTENPDENVSANMSSAELISIDRSNIDIVSSTSSHASRPATGHESNDEQNTPGPISKESKQKLFTLTEIKKLLMGFNLKQLYTEEITNLFEVAPADVIQRLEELKLPTTKHFFTDLLYLKLKREFSVQQINDVKFSLLLLKIAFCSNKKSWTAVTLQEPIGSFQQRESEREIKIDILQAFRIKQLNADVQVMTYDNMKWVMIVERKRTRRQGIKLQKPLFYCFEVNTPYLFMCSTCKVPNKAMECILKAMQYTKYKVNELSGKDLKSLLHLLKNRPSYKEKLNNMEYEPGLAEIGARTIDYTQRKARKNYAEKVFDSEKPILLDKFVAHADTVWHKNDLVPEMEGETWKVTMTITSKPGQLINMIKEMQANDMIATPMPNYLQQIMRGGKNKVFMRSAGNRALQ